MALTALAAAQASERRMGPTSQSLAGILRAIDTHVATAATLGERDCIAPLPLFLPDATQFNIDHSILREKIIKHYTDKGFYARDLGPFRMYISWRNPRRSVKRPRGPQRTMRA